MLSKVDAIKKAQKNSQQGFMFRGIDDIYNALHPLLNEARVFPVCRIKSVDYYERVTDSGKTLLYCRLKATYRFYAEDGSHVYTEVAAEGMDSGDKATNKAMSAAYKYAILQLLCIPTEVVDSDATTPEPSKAKRNGKANGKADDSHAPPEKPTKGYELDLKAFEKAMVMCEGKPKEDVITRINDFDAYTQGKNAAGVYTKAEYAKITKAIEDALAELNLEESNVA